MCLYLMIVFEKADSSGAGFQLDNESSLPSMKPKRWIIGAWLAFFLPNALGQEKIEVISLRYHRAEQLIPLIKPLVGPGGAVTGTQNHLVVRADAAQHAQIRQLLEQIDVAPRNLRITVRQNTTRAALNDDVGMYGRIGGRTRLTIPDQLEPDSARVEARGRAGRIGAGFGERNSSEKSSDLQSLRVLEGSPAFIRLGQSIPFRARNVYLDGRGATVVETNQFVDVISGFQVLPRIVGETVTLEIMPQRNSLGERGEINVQQAATTLSARLGEWIELGTVDNTQANDANGTLYSRQATQSDRRGIFVRVDEVR